MNEKKVNFEEIWKRIELFERTTSKRLAELEERAERVKAAREKAKEKLDKEKQLDRSFQKSVVEFVIGDHQAQKYTMAVINKMEEKKPEIKALQAEFKKKLQTVNPDNVDEVAKEYRERLADILK